MILQYNGFKNNWCYEEANTIIWANVYVGDICKKYKKTGLDKSCKDISLYEDLIKEINEKIIEETACDEEIIFLVKDKPIIELSNICVVCLADKNKHTTYVFEKGVYILNNSGTTVQKIA